mmetsp:Transcript_22389/g.16870  ORF Transcript_22389/g.16870 Transcript_22389/m.16870 type:complete len:117 (+) Transcript_22389:149-499(+)
MDSDVRGELLQGQCSNYHGNDLHAKIIGDNENLLMEIQASRAKIFEREKMQLMAFITGEKEKDISLLLNQDQLVQDILSKLPSIKGSLIDFTILNQNTIYLLYRHAIIWFSLSPFL